MSRGPGKAQQAFMRALVDCSDVVPPKTARTWGAKVTWDGAITWCEYVNHDDGRLVNLTWLRRVAKLPEERTGKSNMSRLLQGLERRGWIVMFTGSVKYDRFALLTESGRATVSDWKKNQSLTEGVGET